MTDANTAHHQFTTPQQVAADIAREYREDARRWTQLTWARRSFERFANSCNYDSGEAVCWCLRGAVNKRVGLGSLEMATLEAFDAALGDPPDDALDGDILCVRWNDAKGRTVEEVIALCDKVAAS